LEEEINTKRYHEKNIIYLLYKINNNGHRKKICKT